MEDEWNLNETKVAPDASNKDTQFFQQWYHYTQDMAVDVTD